jgi:hypothetical protein
MNFARIFPALCLAACTTPHVYEAEQPKMDFIGYFSGITHGYGAIYDFRGRITDRFHVLMNGTPGTDETGRRTLYLAEDFTYTSGKTQKRAWSVTQTAPGKLTATAVDVPGFAEGEESGNAVRFRYPLTITREGGSKVTLSSTDWMWMMPGNTLLNRNKLSKFGIPVAELVISFTKNP